MDARIDSSFLKQTPFQLDFISKIPKEYPDRICPLFFAEILIFKSMSLILPAFMFDFSSFTSFLLFDNNRVTMYVDFVFFGLIAVYLQ